MAWLMKFFIREINMAITYNKHLTKKDRSIMGHGPRDLQRKHEVGTNSIIDAALVDDLKSQIRILHEQLNNRPSSEGGWTSDQVNEEIAKSIKSELKIVRSDYEAKIEILKEKNKNAEQSLLSFKESREKDSEIMNRLREENSSLKSEVSSLKDKLSNKEEIIQHLKDSQTNNVGLSEDKIAKLIAEATKNMATTINAVAPTDRPQMETIFVDPIEDNNKKAVESHINVEDISVAEKEKMNDSVSKLKNLLGKLPTKR